MRCQLVVAPVALVAMVSWVDAAAACTCAGGSPRPWRTEHEVCEGATGAFLFGGATAARIGLLPFPSYPTLVIEHPRFPLGTRAVQVVITRRDESWNPWMAWFVPDDPERTVLKNDCCVGFDDLPVLRPGQPFCVSLAVPDAAGNLVGGESKVCGRAIACLPVIEWFAASCHEVPATQFRFDPSPPLREIPDLVWPRRLGRWFAVAILAIGVAMLRRRKRALV